MKIDEELYYAPGVSFRRFDVHSPAVVEQFRARIEGYYLDPARQLAAQDHAFAAVLLLASAIDAIARYAEPGGKRNGERYVAWLQKALPSLSVEAVAQQFYDDVRCGLVHEARAKRGCAFTSLTGRAVAVEKGAMAVNPVLFVEEVAMALEAFCDNLNSSVQSLEAFQARLRVDFEHETRSSAMYAGSSAAT